MQYEVATDMNHIVGCAGGLYAASPGYNGDDLMFVLFEEMNVKLSGGSTPTSKRIWHM
jgi:hypothetical protein